MARKLKGKATKELKGDGKRRREKEYQDAKDLLIKFLPLFLVVLVSILGGLSYLMMKEV